MKNDAKTKIMAAALEIFAKYGYENSTIKAICKDADVNIAAVNYHFGSKKDLYLAVVNKLADRLLPQMREDLESPRFKDIKEPELFLEELIKMAVSCDKDDIHSYWHEIMHREIFNPSEAFEFIYDRNFKPFIESIRSSLEAIMPNYDKEKLKYFLFAGIAQTHMIKGASGMLRGYFGNDIYDDEKMKKLAKEITIVTCNGIKNV
ncbi:MAG: CerR family C-terminal domain-containing protein [Lentisphaerae bacterium]|nr:CerR family C-terminal domain-containing protein [Lentisphaerota bacterium]MCP4103672.1 CerR family C-terminal domain-containing protein [Lentisphaerota bacterium]